MIRSGTIHTIHELATQGKSIHAIARELGIARNTVRRYLRGKPEAVPRPKRGSKLDAYKGQIHRWINEDHLLNCEVMLPRLQAQGYTGSSATLRAYVQTLRPRNVGRMPVIRYETKPGEQMQYDWGEFHYEQEGKARKFYGFTAILGYSRMRFVTFVKRCDTATMLRCMIEAFDYFGGLPKAALTDRMKSVFLEELDGDAPRWNPLFADFMATLGVAPRVCRPRKPQTKGKVERTVEVVKYGFWPGVHFTDLADLNEQATAWCTRLNQKVHHTTRRVPLDLWVEEHLSVLPKDSTWERFGAEERRVSSDGFVSFDGVLYGLPSSPPMAGARVQVSMRQRHLRVFYQGMLVATHQVRSRSAEIVLHPEQFAGVPPTPSLRQALRPLGHQIPAPEVEVRTLAEYDQLFGLETLS
ncbi:MAG TPA: IS21 family transposase [Ktedonobacteraceae bacterium]|nr:IS21 family transposase [Ktedonobacteraceae bacterium]